MLRRLSSTYQKNNKCLELRLILYKHPPLSQLQSVPFCFFLSFNFPGSFSSPTLPVLSLTTFTLHEYIPMFLSFLVFRKDGLFVSQNIIFCFFCCLGDMFLGLHVGVFFSGFVSFFMSYPLAFPEYFSNSSLPGSPTPGIVLFYFLHNPYHYPVLILGFIFCHWNEAP